MIVGTVAPGQGYSLYSHATTSRKTEITKTTYREDSSANNQDFRLKKSNPSSVWAELATKYDVRNATFDEINSISKALYDNGEISLKDVAILTFDQKKATDYLKQKVPGLTSEEFSMYQHSVSSEGTRDWIAEMEARAQKDFEYGNLIGFQNSKKVLNILQKLDSM
ncbi:hypothetical protein ERJ70_09820 [Sediminibacillus dalangtanensis]|uniref:Uncharacterized protein n=1 Tax=Sediminibacillus dalangtanensis TaxID=2729421 RepID=A0ABX7VVE2_9BACI|nr:hypothetical protein [Sediminibacillus dalangtanensis]QTM99570.1 hypothetical protein ERJ70_09820 [Sediminibacillus dalangtanensis]